VSHRPGQQLPYRLIAGVEPVPGGWLAVVARLSGSVLAPLPAQFLPTFVELLDMHPKPDVIGIHVPIGLPDTPGKGGRECERAVRRMLGWPRSGTVQSAPARPTMEARSFEEAKRLNHGISTVSWQLLPRIADVEREFGPYLQRRLYEVHPELSLYELNGGVPMQYGKKTEKGRAERRELLVAKVPGIAAVLDTPPRRIATFHLYDACADLWSARRIAIKAAVRVPQDAPWDSKGLRMEIYR